MISILRTTPADLASGTTAPPVAQKAAVPMKQWDVVLRGGNHALIRPICKQDYALERRFIEGLSPRSRRFRFLDTIKSPSSALLKQLVEIDPTRDVALIALLVEATGEEQIGVARLCGAADLRSCEFAITVSDAWQRKGLGTHLMRQLIKSAVSRGVESMYSVDSADNEMMRGFALHHAMERVIDPNDSTQVIHTLDLKMVDSTTW